jgi:hypothetical protein
MYEHARIQKQIHLACMVPDMHGLGRLVCRTAELDDNFAFYTHAHNGGSVDHGGGGDVHCCIALC